MDNNHPQTSEKAAESQTPASIGRESTLSADQYTGQPFPMGRPVASQGPAQATLALPDEAEMDKAWVDQAVVALEKTRDDPFLQSQEIAKIRAQYMQSKFDKKIKLAQERQ